MVEDHRKYISSIIYKICNYKGCEVLFITNRSNAKRCFAHQNRYYALKGYNKNRSELSLKYWENKRKVPFKKIIDTYIETESFMETGRRLGVSREWVRLVINKYGNTKTDSIHEKYKHHRKEYWKNKKCLSCERVFGLDISINYRKKDYCFYCYKKGVSLGIIINIPYSLKGRNKDYPCLDCGKMTSPGRKFRSNGRCSTCYSLYYYKTSEKRRVNQKKHMLRYNERKKLEKWRLEHPPETTYLQSCSLLEEELKKKPSVQENAPK